jgi:hypothetical protein
VRRAPRRHGIALPKVNAGTSVLQLLRLDGRCWRTSQPDPFRASASSSPASSMPRTASARADPGVSSFLDRFREVTVRSGKGARGVDGTDAGFAGTIATSASIFNSGMPRTRPRSRASTRAPSDKRLPRLKVSADANTPFLTIRSSSGYASGVRKCPRSPRSRQQIRQQSGRP